MATGGVALDVVDDIENEKQQIEKQENVFFNPRFLAAAAVFTLYSYLVMNEGAVRTAMPPSPALPEAVLRISTSGEMMFGLAGVLVGLAIILFRVGNKAMTMAWMALALVFGWFVFAVYVLALPIYGLVNTRVAPEGLTLGQFDVLRVMSLFGGITWCFALQGGQFMVGNVILGHQSNGSKGVGYARARMIMWSANVTVSGIVFLIAGIVARSVFGAGPLPRLAFPPIFIVYPALTITAGIIQIVYGLVAIAGAVMGSMLGVVGMMGTFSFLFSLATIVWTQSLVSPGAIPPTTLLAGLCLMLHSNVLYSSSELKHEIDERE